MKTFQLFLIVLTTFLLAGWAPQTQAGVVLIRDNFNTENGGVGAANFTNFSQWMVMGSGYNLLPVGSPNPHPNHGLHVGFGLGWLVNNQTLNLAPGDYRLKFDAAGSGIGNANIINASLDGFFSDFWVIDSNSGFTTITRDFSLNSPLTTHLFFDSDDRSVLLDNVELVQLEGNGPTVPEPTTALLFGMCTLGVVGCCWLRRRRAVA